MTVNPPSLEPRRQVGWSPLQGYKDRRQALPVGEGCDTWVWVSPGICRDSPPNPAGGCHPCYEHVSLAAG